MFDTYQYEKLYSLKLSKDTIKKIMDLMLEIRPREKPFSMDRMNNEFHIVYCNCSDGDIFSENTADAFYDDTYQNVIFIDPFFKSRIWINIAHELVHALQEELYLFMDGIDTPYKERWEEQMAYTLESAVEKIIRKEKLKFILKEKDPLKIEFFLYSIIMKNEKHNELEEWFEKMGV